MVKLENNSGGWFRILPLSRDKSRQVQIETDSVTCVFSEPVLWMSEKA